MNVGFAAVKGVYNGKVKLDELQPPSHYKMLIDGKGKQGFIKGNGILDLEEQNGQTLLSTAVIFRWVDRSPVLGNG